MQDLEIQMVLALGPARCEKETLFGLNSVTFFGDCKGYGNQELVTLSVPQRSPLRSFSERKVM